MPLEFTARVAGVDDTDALMAGVAEHPDGTGQQLIFQASLEPPEDEDADLGMDSYCLVMADQRTAYGCLDQVAIDGDVLRLVLREDAPAELGLPDRAVAVTLAVDVASIEALREALRNIVSYGRPDARPAVLRL
jgi:hypothetical protein